MTDSVKKTEYYYIGISGGGTKTIAWAFKLGRFKTQRVALRVSIHKPSNPMVLDKKIFLETLGWVFRLMLQKIRRAESSRPYTIGRPFRILSIGLALAGAKNMSNELKTSLSDELYAVQKAVFGSLYYNRNHNTVELNPLIEQKFPIDIQTDASGTLATYFKRDDKGIVLIAGTGSVCILGNGRGEILKQAGGLGWFLSDEGSAFWIAKRILRYVLELDQDNISDEGNHLLNEILCNFGIPKEKDSRQRLLAYLNQSGAANRSNIATVAELVSRQLNSFDQNDQSQILLIFKKAGRELRKLINKVLANRNEIDDISKLPIILEGGVFNAWRMIHDGLDPERELKFYIPNPNTLAFSGNGYYCLVDGKYKNLVPDAGIGAARLGLLAWSAAENSCYYTSEDDKDLQKMVEDELDDLDALSSLIRIEKK